MTFFDIFACIVPEYGTFYSVKLSRKPLFKDISDCLSLKKEQGLMKKKCSFLLVLLAAVSMSVTAQTSKESIKDKTEDPDNLAKEYFSQVMGVAVSATTS